MCKQTLIVFSPETSNADEVIIVQEDGISIQLANAGTCEVRLLIGW